MSFKEKLRTICPTRRIHVEPLSRRPLCQIDPPVGIIVEKALLLIDDFDPAIDLIVGF